MAYFIVYLYFFLVAACLGSFMNVVAYRLPRGETIARGRSHCPACGHTIRARDLVPVFSWLFLRGKCRDCGAKISPRYVAVEIASGAAALLAVFDFGISLRALCAAAVFLVLMTIALIDLETMDMHDVLLIVFSVLALLSALVFKKTPFPDRAIGAACVSLPMLILTLFVKGAFGGGDIWLMAAAGFMLGWKGVLVGFFIALLAEGVWLLVLAAKKKLKRGAQLPFGPALCFGIYISLLYGDFLLGKYLGLF